MYMLFFREFFQLFYDNINYGHLSSCFTKAKELFKILLRDTERTIYPEDCMLDILAANIKEPFLQNIIAKNNDKKNLDFLDYLSYFPLFVHIHDTIINKPISHT